ncbi:MAG: PSD1 and planctomycete cytochrome C domain-containing protein [Planctomycetales bacterium]|nr:PSD1 and planctomycete cytochrome C domain-containing protein [Planctomycetales bacterium]
MRTSRRSFHRDMSIAYHRSKTYLLLSAVLAFFVSAMRASGEDMPDLNRDIRPLFRDYCVKCHGPLRQDAKLNLSVPVGIARGGEGGAVIVPGQPKDSRLWQLVEQDEMPKGTPLSADEKDVLKRWIAAGAPGLPRPGDAIVADETHWAFRKLSRPAAAVVNQPGQIRNALDAHVAVQLEAAGLTMSPEATRETLIRRVALDLTGVPPSTEEIDQFINDASPSAYEQMVERYLASPGFGERWGKHWLDAAGYADSNGYFSADTDRPLAFRYRDYVIRSINTDKPFDRFIREQLCGDEMVGFRPGQPVKSDEIDLLEATHFLRNGQDGSDIGVQEPEAFEIDRRAALEAVVQVTGTSLLGLSFHCARCHDHKYDPITQKEYYQLQAIFFPAFNPQDWINPRDRTIYAYLPGEKEQWEERDSALKQQLAQLKAEYSEWLAANREPSELLFEEAFGEGWQSRWSATAPGDDKPSAAIVIGAAEANAARVQEETLQIIAGSGEAWLSTAQAFDWTPAEKGDWIQATFDIFDNKVSGGPAERIGYNIAVHDFDDSGSLEGGNILIDGNPSAATSIYRDYPGVDQKVLGAIGSQGYVAGRNFGVRVTNIGDGQFRLEHCVDGLQDGASLNLTAADLPDGGFSFFYCVNRSFVVDNVRIERSVAVTSAGVDVAAIRKTLEERFAQYEKERKELEAQRSPEPGRPIAWVSDKSAKPPVVPFLTRGQYHLREGDLPPMAPAALSESGEEYLAPVIVAEAATTGRRTAFADWLLRPHSRPAALMARVHVNRVWRQYFGRGIVETTDNLGIAGSPPSHPDLLEELAAGFVADGWSQKSLHRRIVNSAVYRQSSAARPEGLAADSDNRLWWRWSVRRLEAEVIRDSMLSVAGQLDPKASGPYVPTKQTAIGEVVAEEQTPGALRRSVYLQQRRSQILSFMKVFDAPAVATICTTRPSSTVPLQSLALLNSDFAVARAEAFARRLLSETTGSPEELVHQGWRIAAGRAPTDREAAIAAEFLQTQQAQYSGDEARLRAVSDFCQMLLASNAFLYVE